MAHSVLRRFAQIAATFALLASTSTLPVVAQETETAVRVMVSDAGNGDLTVLDPASGEVVGRFTTPVGGYSALYPSSTGRYLLANHYAGDQVTIVDAGVALEPHGDHADLVIEAPFVRATVATGPRQPTAGRTTA